MLGKRNAPGLEKEERDLWSFISKYKIYCR